MLARFGEIHPKILDALDVAGPIVAFEVMIDAIPKPKVKPTKTKPGLTIPDLQPVRRDFAFIVAKDQAADVLVRAAAGADKKLITGVTLFDAFEGGSLGADEKSLAVEVTLQPQDKTLTDKELEAVSDKIVAAVEKATGGKTARLGVSEQTVQHVAPCRGPVHLAACRTGVLRADAGKVDNIGGLSGVGLVQARLLKELRQIGSASFIDPCEDSARRVITRRPAAQDTFRLCTAIGIWGSGDRMLDQPLQLRSAGPPMGFDIVNDAVRRDAFPVVQHGRVKRCPVLEVPIETAFCHAETFGKRLHTDS